MAQRVFMDDPVIMLQGWRMITGQSRESMMVTVSHMGKIAVIVSVASTMALGGINLSQFITNDLARGINQLVTGSDDLPAAKIDESLVIPK
jgi:type IV secretion system protein VirB6